MAHENETIMQVLANYVNDVKNIFSIEKVYLYGSYAKGLANEYSDIDVCFFLSTFGSKRSVDIVTELLTIAGKYSDYYIEPRAFPFTEIENNNPFVKEVLRTGYEVLLQVNKKERRTIMYARYSEKQRYKNENVYYLHKIQEAKMITKFSLVHNGSKCTNGKI